MGVTVFYYLKIETIFNFYQCLKNSTKNKYAQRLHKVLLFVLIKFFLAEEANPRLCIVSTFQVSLVFLSLENFFKFAFTLVTWAFFIIIGHSFCRTLFSLDWCDVSPWLDSSYYFRLKYNIINPMLFSLHYDWWNMMFYPISGKNFDHLIKMLSSIFLHCKNKFYIFSSFLLITILWGRLFEIM